MKKTNKTNKKQAAAWVLSLLPLVMIAAVYRRLPAEVPMHWDLDGAVDYEGKNASGQQHCPGRYGNDRYGNCGDCKRRG